MPSDLEQRIIALEEVIAYQSKTIEELSEQLIDQWKVVEKTRMKLAQLTESFLALEEESRQAAPITKPPHY
jgi:SlyX protein